MSTMTFRSTSPPIRYNHYEKFIPREGPSKWFFIFCSKALRWSQIMKGIFHIFQLLENFGMKFNHLSFKFSWHIRSCVPGSNFYNVWYWSNQYAHIADTPPHHTKIQVLTQILSGTHLIKLLGSPNTGLALFLFLLGTTAYSSSSSSSFIYKMWSKRFSATFLREYCKILEPRKS